MRTFNTKTLTSGVHILNLLHSIYRHFSITEITSQHIVSEDYEQQLTVMEMRKWKYRE